MLDKILVSETEYDKMNQYKQMNYRWCTTYEMFYLNEINGTCNALMICKIKCKKCPRFKGVFDDE